MIAYPVLLVHAFMLFVLIAKRYRNGKTANKYFPLWRVVLLVLELVFFFNWLLLMVDAF